MSKDDACDRAKRALMNICGEDEDRFNTVYVEVVVEQGSKIRRSTINNLTDWAQDLVRNASYLDGPGLPRDMRLETRDVFVIRGDERPQETKDIDGDVGGVRVGGESKVFRVSPENRAHIFFPFENNTMSLNQLDTFKYDVERRWDRSSVSNGMGLNSINVVDPAVVRAAAPQRTGRPMEDVERF